MTDSEVPSIQPETSPESGAGQTSNRLITLAIALATLVLGFFIGYLWRGAGLPAEDSADVGFARDMSIHHEQAVQMAALIYDRTDDEAIRSLAFDILTTQQGQIGIMSGWLDAWGHPWTSAGPRMSWMGMPVDGLMPGMATSEQLAALRAAEGTAADIIFLQLMIPHHQGGVAMAQAAVDQAQSTPVKLLAQGMVDGQSLEIDYMQELLLAKGSEPVPDLPMMDHDSDHGDH
jgi:uncharacterized protein (DUF305 family)